ncbi:type VI secretion system ATPase TssH [Lysobacter arvi]|uniref:Type VI secretion system ATPase TssH n=1 Tax=Lysobacter arvi TaxID=3038776 RepID=A0ABU1CEB2_9GAMM|nr:type VI secretion system ATPase TssH [Lysobacter arvi]MDR0183465.1 type VI secretion system ATPase TssH [Lysobacter arvi]
MLRTDLAALLGRLNDYCRHGLEEAGALCLRQRGAEVTVAQLLYTLIDQPLGDVRLLIAHAGTDVDALKRALSEDFIFEVVEDGATPAFSPLLVELMQEAWLIGSIELGESRLRGGLLLLAALLNPHRYLPRAATRLFESINRESLRTHFARLLADSAETPKASGSHHGAASGIADGSPSALQRFGIDFTAQAADGAIDPVLGRGREIELMVDILSRRRKNNPIVVGEAGVGKSALVEGLALRIVRGQVPAKLRGVALWGLDLGALQAGASVKGEFEKRLKAVMDEVKSSPVPIVLFIDEAHTMIGAGNAAGGSDAANLLKPALARGELRTIAATTWSEYKKYFEKDPALSRRFQLVKLEEPTPEQALPMLRGLRTVYERSHGVLIQDAALQAACQLSARYLSGRQLPDKAIDVLDTACARVATGLASPPRRVAALDNALHAIQVEREVLERDRNAGHAIEVQRLEALAQQRLELTAERAALEGAWQEQKALVERIVQLREAATSETPVGDGDEVVTGISSKRSEEPSDNDIAIASPSVTIADHATALRDAVATLAELQRTGGLLHADVGPEQVAQVIGDWTGIPVDSLSEDRLERLRTLPQVLGARIQGQDDAIVRVHRHLLTAMADLRRPGTPLGAFLLVGPSGVGKTETALQIAEHLFGGRQFLTVINLSEYQEKHTVSRLIGSPPGYVGFGEGGLLTEALRQKPYSVVLLDEVEKAHPDVLNLFYQVFDKGELTDGEGRLIDCKNALFFLTSNLGYDKTGSDLIECDEPTLRRELQRFFKPALLARMQVVRYRFLDEDVLGRIVEQRVKRLIAQFAERYRAELTVTQAAQAELRARCSLHTDGARLLDAVIDGELLPPLSLAVLNRVATRMLITQAELDWRDDAFEATVA